MAIRAALDPLRPALPGHDAVLSAIGPPPRETFRPSTLLADCAWRTPHRGRRQVEIRKGDATVLPIADGSIDVVSSNGVVNLVPEKDRAFGEIVRILKPGGRLHLADIALDVELPEDARRNIDLWTA